MKTIAILATLLIAAKAAAGEPVEFRSPGLPPSHVDAQGRLCEDWGTLGVKLDGPGVTDGPVKVEAVKLDNLIPAAQATSDRGAVRLVCTAYRAPTFPAGLDVFTVRVEEAKGQAANVTVSLAPPAKTRISLRSLKIGSRTVLTLPVEAVQDQKLREWGSCDESTAMPGWAKPEGKCDPAFRNIRAGMGGSPIVYRFAVAPKSEAYVVLGFCESHWKDRGERPLVCRVEGAEPKPIDPIAAWGRHKPGALLFSARDENGDGQLEISVRGVPGAPDRNPILNAIWIFPPKAPPDLRLVVAGELTKGATRYVDVGGENDQTLYPPARLEYPLSLPAHGAQELVFWAACPGSTIPPQDNTAWTTDRLRRASYEVWRDWSEQ